MKQAQRCYSEYMLERCVALLATRDEPRATAELPTVRIDFFPGRDRYLIDLQMLGHGRGAVAMSGVRHVNTREELLQELDGWI